MLIGEGTRTAALSNGRAVPVSGRPDAVRVALTLSREIASGNEQLNTSAQEAKQRLQKAVATPGGKA